MLLGLLLVSLVSIQSIYNMFEWGPGAGAGEEEGEGRQRIVAPRSIVFLFARKNSHTDNLLLKLGMLITAMTPT